MHFRHHGREIVTKGTVKTSHWWSDECGEPGEIPTWAGSGMEWECDQVPSADEESRNTLEVTGAARGGMVNSTRAPEKRESAQGQGAEHHRCQVPSGLQQHGKRWAIREGGDNSDGVRG